MKVLRVGVVLKTSSGGMWILPQVKALRAHAEVVVFIPEGDGRLARQLDALAAADPGLTVRKTTYRFSFLPTVSNVREFLRFARELRQLRLDAVLYHLYASTLATRFALIGTATRRVQMVAGPLHLEAPVIRLFERFLLRLDDAVIGGSEDIRRRYVELGADPSKLKAIPYGVDTQSFSPDLTGERRVTARRKLSIGVDEFLVVMIAFVYPPKSLVHAGKGIKGHAELLEAWLPFEADHPGARLIIVGGGFQLQGEAYKTELINALPTSLESMGAIWMDTVEDVRELYDAADLSVSPSLSENHGAALEASAMSVPSIVSDAGGLPETVEHGETGWIVPAGQSAPLANALAEAYRVWRGGELHRMGAMARAKTVGAFDSSEAGERVALVVLEGISR